MTSREFNQDASRAKKAAALGPVYITDRGRPAHVLLTYEAYEELLGNHSVVELLAQPAGVEEIEMVVPTSTEFAAPASFD